MGAKEISSIIQYTDPTSWIEHELSIVKQGRKSVYEQNIHSILLENIIFKELRERISFLSNLSQEILFNFLDEASIGFNTIKNSEISRVNGILLNVEKIDILLQWIGNKWINDFKNNYYESEPIKSSSSTLKWLQNYIKNKSN